MYDDLIVALGNFGSAPSDDDKSAVYRIEVPCALYIDAANKDELVSRLDAIFSNIGEHEVKYVPGAPVFYPGFANLKAAIADVWTEGETR